jgi:hypothetical protein
VSAVFQIRQLRYQGDLVTGQALARIALRDAVNLAMNAMAVGVEPQECLAVQKAIEVKVGLFADQLKVKAKGQADKFIAHESMNLEITRLPIQGQIKGTLIGRSEHPVFLCEG